VKQKIHTIDNFLKDNLFNEHVFVGGVLIVSNRWEK